LLRCTQTQANRIVFETIQHNIKQVQNFPTQGRLDRLERWTKSKQVTLRCKDTTKTQRCKGNAAAFTQPALAADIELWTITFCPDFFTDNWEHVEDLIAKGPVAVDDMNFHLKIRERALVHEYMHANIMVRNHHTCHPGFGTICSMFQKKKMENKLTRAGHQAATGVGGSTQ
jgi:hypothetical protein